MAVQMLFQVDLGGKGITANNVFARFNLEEYSKSREPEDGYSSPDLTSGNKAVEERRDESFAYAKELVEGALSRKDEIDDLIRSQTDHWRIERMPAVDRNILRLAVYEFLSQTDVPKLVVIDEAIELAKRFGSDQSGAFVNGLLDGLLKHQEFPGSIT